MMEPIERIKRSVAQRPGLAAFAGALLCGMLLMSIAHAVLPPARTPAGRVMAVPTATATVIPTPTATPIPFARPDLEAGITFPEWSTSAYGATDGAWAQGVVDIRQQTGARWLGMVVNFYQNGYNSTDVFAGTGTPSPDDLAAGITTARAQGFQVFVFPLLTVLNVPNNWGAGVHFDDPAQSAAWFAGYWRALEPYAAAAARAGAAQLSIGHEYGGMETAPASQWKAFIQYVHAAFPGKLTYDINWSELGNAPQSWMSDPLLSYIGISEYTPLTNAPQALSTDQMLAVWHGKLLPLLDKLSAVTGKPIILAEIGYRNTADSLYQPWVWHTSAAAAPQLQADAYSAAAEAVFSDPHVDGIFFYAWRNGQFAPSPQAAAALRTLYLSPAA
jgi:Glycoside Hydrolase Family 113